MRVHLFPPELPGRQMAVGPGELFSSSWSRFPGTGGVQLAQLVSSTSGTRQGLRMRPLPQHRSKSLPPLLHVCFPLRCLLALSAGKVNLHWLHLSGFSGVCNINSRQVRSAAHALFCHHRLLSGSPHSRSGAAAVVASSSSS